MGNIRILDLDLDFFLSGISRREKPRAESQGLIPWIPERVHSFLQGNCELRAGSRLRGSVLTTHDELFYRWREKYNSGPLSETLDVVHVDAHADLGGGMDGSWVYIMSDLLRLPVQDRWNPKKGNTILEGGLHEGNYLLFAIACRWIVSLTYVYHAERNADPTSHEVPRMYFRENSYQTHELQLKSVAKEDINGVERPWNLKPLHVEPSVTYRALHPDQFHWNGSFDYMFLTLSPTYTPASADCLIPLFQEYFVLT